MTIHLSNFVTGTSSSQGIFLHQNIPKFMIPLLWPAHGSVSKNSSVGPPSRFHLHSIVLSLIELENEGLGNGAPTDLPMPPPWHVG